MSTPILQIDIGDTIDETIADVIDFLPGLVAALLILVIGWAIGRVAYRVVVRVADRVQLDRAVVTTPIGRMLGGSERAVARTFGRIAAWFVYALAILAASDVLAVELLSEWVSDAVSYLPAFVAGTLIILVGFVLADFLGDAIARTQTVTGTAYTGWFADGVRFFLYFVAIVIGLDTIGVDVEILYTFTEALSLGVAVGVALAIGIAFGWGGKDYVGENIGDWLSSGSDTLSPPEAAGDDD
jgi:small-conductance mechanosensitive channel